MSNGEERKVSQRDIDLVHKLIEMSLQLYMSKTEVVNKLFRDARIEPVFTETVWEELKAENEEFFRIYNKMLAVKDQTLQFNQLLKESELKHQMMHRYSPFQDQQPHIPFIQPDMYPVASVGPHVYTNGTYSPQQCTPAYMSGHAGRMDFHAHMPLVQNSNAGIMQGFNEGAYNHLLQPHNKFGEASISPFNGGASCSQPFNGTLLETEMMNPLGVEQMTPNFGASCSQPFNWTMLETEMNPLGVEQMTPKFGASCSQPFNGTLLETEMMNPLGVEQMTPNVGAPCSQPFNGTLLETEMMNPLGVEQMTPNFGAPCSQPFNGTLLETEMMNPLGVEQMTPNFGASCSQPFNGTLLETEMNPLGVEQMTPNLLNPHIRAEDEEFRRLDTWSEEELWMLQQ